MGFGRRGSHVFSYGHRFTDFKREKNAEGYTLFAGYMKAMKTTPVSPKPISIPPDIAARCNGPDQADRMDKVFRAVISVPHSAVLKDERKRKKARARKSRA